MTVPTDDLVFDHTSGKLSSLDAAVVAAVPPGGNWRDLPADFPSKRIEQIRASAARGEGSRSTYYGRLRWDRPSYTISTYFNRPGNGCFIHPEAPRLITVREAARLQGFPDSYRFYGRGRSRYIQVGNAVPPLLAFQIARQLEPGPVADFFSGAGGLSLGFKLAGHQLLAAVDNDEAANETLRLNHSGDGTVVLRADLSDEVQHRRVVREIARRASSDGLTTLVGGPPCQGFSTAGRCDLSDPRNKLVFAYLEAVAALRPETVVFENVAALLWRGRQVFLRAITDSLRNMGYTPSVSLVHAESFGLPQLRRRVLLIARRSAEVKWPKPAHIFVQPAQPQLQEGGALAAGVRAPITVAEAIADMSRASAADPDVPVAYGSDPASPFQRWARGQMSIEHLVAEDASLVSAGELAA